MRQYAWLFAITALFTLFHFPVHASSISGKVRYEGVVPQFKPIKMSGDPVCMSHHKAKVYPEVLVLGDNNAMANIIVSLVNPPHSDTPVPSDPMVLDQDGCVYSPHVVCLRSGQPLKILNPDGTLHNVHAMPKINAEFNMAMPKFRKVAMKKFSKTEIKPFPVKCDVHPWMTAWIAVFDHPYYRVTSKKGVFTLENVPQGHYKVQAWHEKLGSRFLEIDVTEGKINNIEFVFKR